ncbi:hypothetical protein L195_g062536, partial [Trifolium pratense]
RLILLIGGSGAQILSQVIPLEEHISCLLLILQSLRKLRIISFGIPRFL